MSGANRGERTPEPTQEDYGYQIWFLDRLCVPTVIMYALAAFSIPQAWLEMTLILGLLMSPYLFMRQAVLVPKSKGMPSVLEKWSWYNRPARFPGATLNEDVSEGSRHMTNGMVLSVIIAFVGTPLLLAIAFYIANTILLDLA